MVATGAGDLYGEDTLEKIIQDIYIYLQRLGVKRFNAFLGKRGPAQRCAASWTEINIQLSEFVQDPKNNYSKLMNTIDNEKEKFQATPKYVEKLTKLETFLKQSPKFSQDYHCQVRMPTGFDKRKSRSNKKA